MAISLAPLPYAQDALQPFLSERTLEYHYGKHHRKYVDTVNGIIQGSRLDRMQLEDILFESWGKNKKLFNNASQVWNHNFYWTCLTPSFVEPSTRLRQMLAEGFGSVAELQEKFDQQGSELFGSGWIWLIKNRKGEIRIQALSDAENPLLVGDTPLLCCDIWEHAYYLDYQNDRARYMEAFWSAVNWRTVEQCLMQSSARSAS